MILGRRRFRVNQILKFRHSGRLCWLARALTFLPALKLFIECGKIFFFHCHAKGLILKRDEIRIRKSMQRPKPFQLRGAFLFLLQNYASIRSLCHFDFVTFADSCSLDQIRRDPYS